MKSKTACVETENRDELQEDHITWWIENEKQITQVSVV